MHMFRLPYRPTLPHPFIYLNTIATIAVSIGGKMVSQPGIDKIRYEIKQEIKIIRMAKLETLMDFDTTATFFVNSLFHMVHTLVLQYQHHMPSQSNHGDPIINT